MPGGLSQSDFRSIDAAANRWPDPWPDRFRERVAIMWTLNDEVALNAWRAAYSATMEQAKTEGAESLSVNSCGTR